MWQAAPASVARIVSCGAIAKPRAFRPGAKTTAPRNKVQKPNKEAVIALEMLEDSNSTGSSDRQHTLGDTVGKCLRVNIVGDLDSPENRVIRDGKSWRETVAEDVQEMGAWVLILGGIYYTVLRQR